MPELGEVETVAGRLLAMIVGGSDVALSLPLHSSLSDEATEGFCMVVLPGNVVEAGSPTKFIEDDDRFSKLC